MFCFMMIQKRLWFVSLHFILLFYVLRNYYISLQSYLFLESDDLADEDVASHFSRNQENLVSGECPNRFSG